MKKQSLGILGLILLVAIGLTACEKKGPAEKLGEKIDNATEDLTDKGPAEEMGEKIDEAADKAGEKMEELGDKVEKAAD